jgi:hypothetical protein
MNVQQAASSLGNVIIALVMFYFAFVYGAKLIGLYFIADTPVYCHALIGTDFQTNTSRNLQDVWGFDGWDTSYARMTKFKDIYGINRTCYGFLEFLPENESESLKLLNTS